MSWEVRIKGDPADLRMLAEVFVGPEIALVESDSRFILRAPELDAFSDAGLVQERTRELLAVLSGASKVFLGTEKSFDVDGVAQIHGDGSRTDFVLPGTTAVKLRGMPVTLTFTHPDGSVERSFPAEPVASATKKAVQDPAVRKVLRLRAAPDLLWTDLYRIFEVIEEDTGGAKKEKKRKKSRQEVMKRWAPEKQIERFTRTANTVSGSGDLSRHGKGKEPPPPDPMSLDEGRAFIDKIIRKWLASK